MKGLVSTVSAGLLKFVALEINKDEVLRVGEFFENVLLDSVEVLFIRSDEGPKFSSSSLFLMARAIASSSVSLP